MAKKQNKKSGAQPNSVLTTEQQQKLVQCEKIIRNYADSFFHAGRALKEINEEKLYLAFGSFDDYCLQAWNMSKTHAHRLINAYMVMDVLQEEFPDGKPPLPANESQVRPLTSLKLEQVVGKWKLVVKKADGKPITTELVEAVIGKTSASQASKDKINGKVQTLTTRELKDLSKWVAQAKSKLNGSESEVVKLLDQIENVLGRYLK